MKVFIYSTKTCPFCKLEKDYLNKHNIQFTEFFVEDDEKKAREMIDKSGQMGVPVTVIADDKKKEEVIVGFDKDRLNSALGIIERL